MIAVMTVDCRRCRPSPDGVEKSDPALRIRRSIRCAAMTLLLLCTAGRVIAAQNNGGKPFEITDNSFLVEEALNQEPGVVQNIFNLQINRDHQWASTFTQEWPLVTRRHQLSYTIPFSSVGDASGLGDVSLHYRMQVLDGGDFGTSFSPRATLIIPSGRESRGLGLGSPGWEVNLPFSRQVNDVFFNWNAGFTSFPSVHVAGVSQSLFTPRAAASAIWRLRPMVNLMFESVVAWNELPGVPDTSRRTSTTLLPGLRTGWNHGDAQGIVGVGVPITILSGGDGEQSTANAALFLYFSYELPFTH